jgi:tetratricopeptide (TPR) repeat protein
MMSGLLAGFFFMFAGVISPASLERGDLAFLRIDYPRALAIYDSVLGSTEDSADVLWRLARLYVCSGDVAPDDERLGLYRLAEGYAYDCIRADSLKPEGHTWMAAALGNIAMFEGGKTKVKLCTMIKLELDWSLRLDPDDDVAYSILGSFYRALGNVSWIERQLVAIFLGGLPAGGFEDAEAALRKAIMLSPDIIRHHYELGELFVDLDRNQEALGEFRLVEGLPVRLALDARLKLSAAQNIRDLSPD